jgi:Permeases of the drug/metabolite transporter (DMT) superfamily
MNIFSNSSIKSKSILALILCAALWSTAGILIKLVDLNPLAIAGSRSIVAAVVIMLLTGKPKFTFSWLQIGSALAYTGTVLLFVSANKYTNSANAILLQYTAPVYAAIFGYLFLKEKVSKVDLLTIGVVIGGMALFFIDDLAGGSLLGNMLAIISAVTFALQAVLLRKQQDSSPAASLILGNIFTGIIGIPFLSVKVPNHTEILVLLALGVFQLGLSYTLYAYAIKHVTALEAILIPVIEPILNPVWVFVFAGEYPGKWSIIGGLIVILSITGRGLYYEVILKRKQSPKPAERKLDKVNI